MSDLLRFAEASREAYDQYFSAIRVTLIPATAARSALSALHHPLVPVPGY